MLSTIAFLEIYDSKVNAFGEEFLRDMFWGDFIDRENVTEMDTLLGEPDRWNHSEEKVYKIRDRYFSFSRYAGNTEYQEDYYDSQPIEVKPVEKVITVWEAVES